MKKIIKKHYKIIVGVIIVLIISVPVVYAAQTVLSGDEVSYNGESSGSSKNNVQGAIDELYDKVNSCKNVNYIATVEDLEKLRKEVNEGDSKKGQKYSLISDLDLGGKFDSEGNMEEGSTNWEPIGTNEHPFRGIFDGNGHTIKKMYSKKDSEGYVGLFGYVENGTIKNLGIEDSYSVNVTNVSDFSNISMLVGNLAKSTLDSCYNKGNVKGLKSTGGLVGRSNESIIINCYNTGMVDNSNSQFVGGIVGHHNGGRIENCYNVGQIIGNGDVGGIAGGLTSSSIINTYNLGNLNSLVSSGGIVGQLYINGLIKNSYNSGTSKGGIIANVLGNNNQKLENNYYLNGKANYGIYGSTNSIYQQNSSPNGASSLEQNQMPDVLDIINGDKAFIEDINEINNGNPILKWESK